MRYGLLMWTAFIVYASEIHHLTSTLKAKSEVDDPITPKLILNGSNDSTAAIPSIMKAWFTFSEGVWGLF